MGAVLSPLLGWRICGSVVPGVSSSPAALDRPVGQSVKLWPVNTETQFGGCEPILCAPLLRKVDGELIDLLCSLTAEEWDLETIAPRWKVCDVAAHLLDTCLRKLSMVRDGWFAEKARPQSQADVIALVNRLNEEGVRVYRRLSPAVLIDWMKRACDQSASFHEGLDPFAPAVFGVSWAGEETSLNWFDTARELTERWHHQQRNPARDRRAGIMTPELYHPVLDCFARGLPYSLPEHGCFGGDEHRSRNLRRLRGNMDSGEGRRRLEIRAGGAGKCGVLGEAAAGDCVACFHEGHRSGLGARAGRDH